jgi:hypothetical protein
MTADDIAIPFLLILQALSPQVRGATKIDGAREGFIYNTVTKEISQKLTIIPCAYSKKYVEWVPRDLGGGFVKMYDTPDILKQCVRNDKNQDILPNGNSVVTTAYHHVVIVKENGLLERAIIGMSSTQLKRSRRWNSQMLGIQININGKKVTPPMYSHTYSLATEEESRDKNTWFSWLIFNPQIITSAEQYVFARKFHDDITGGSIKIVPAADEHVENTIQDVSEEKNF